jgi:two-component system response regulator PilR (NtrC family)
MPHATQVKLLRALQERRLRRVGASADLPFAARIIAATNRDLAQEVRAGRFREDLFYRLNVIQLRVPALRDRAEDIPLFLDRFLARFAREAGRRAPPIAPAAERLLLSYSYPGNVRELANVVERAVTLAGEGGIDVQVLPPAMRDPGAPQRVRRRCWRRGEWTSRRSSTRWSARCSRPRSSGRGE